MPSEGLQCLLVGSASGEGLHAVGLGGVSSGKSLGDVHEGRRVVTIASWRGAAPAFGRKGTLLVLESLALVPMR